MKSRAIQTRFWDDEQVSEFSPFTKYLYIYLLTCQYINVSGVFQLSDKKMQFEMGLTDKQLKDSQSELTSNDKVLFKDGWVYVKNAEKNNSYRKIPSNEVTYQQEWERVPNAVKEFFLSPKDLPVTDPSVTPQVTPQGLNINNKSQIINNKSQIINHKRVEVPEIMELYNTLFGKKTKSSVSWEANCVYWLNIYSLDEIKKAMQNWKEFGWLWKARDGTPINDIDLSVFFRTANSAGKCDYIGQFLNRIGVKKPVRIDPLEEKLRAMNGGDSDE